MKAIIQSLILLAVILLMTICKSKAKENRLTLTSTDTTAVDIEFINLSSIVDPSLARAIERVSAYIDTASAPNIIHIPGSGQVIEVKFYKMGDEELVQVGYWPVYHQRHQIFSTDSMKKYPTDDDKSYRNEYMKFYLDYKNKMIAFYNLGEQSKHGDLVDSTKLMSGIPVGYLSDMDIDTLRGHGPYGGLFFLIHGEDSLGKHFRLEKWYGF